jgi:hypothetical protein
VHQVNAIAWLDENAPDFEVVADGFDGRGSLHMFDGSAVLEGS